MILYINDIDMQAYCGLTLQAALGIFDPPKPKPRNKYNWNDSNGEDVDLTSPVKFEARQITFKCLIRAANETEFLTRVNALYTLIYGAGAKAVHADYWPTTINVYFDASDNLDLVTKYNQVEMVGTVVIKAIEYDPLSALFKAALVGTGTGGFTQLYATDDILSTQGVAKYDSTGCVSKIIQRAANSIIAVVNNGTNSYMYSTDNGNTWTLANVAEETTIRIVAFNSIFYAYDPDAGSIYSSVDGITWSSISSNATDCSFIVDAAGWFYLVNAAGELYVSDNACASFSLAATNSDVNYLVYSVQGATLVFGHKTAASIIIWGGESFAVVSGTGLASYPRAMFVSSNYVFLAFIRSGPSRAIKRSVDSSNWVTVVTMPSGDFTGFAEDSDGNIYAFKSDGYIYKSIDEGLTFTAFLNYASVVNDILFV